MARALVLVDIQNDFLPGGALGVPDGNEVIPVANRLIPHFETVIATQDWHPPAHGSFASSHPGKQVGDEVQLNGLPQTLWPDHCVQGTYGAELAEPLQKQTHLVLFQKGQRLNFDSYSGFYDNGKRNSTGLDIYLRAAGILDLVVLGLATDYCVKFTVLDACELGFRTAVIPEGCRAVNVHPGDEQSAYEAMLGAGARLLSSDAALAISAR